MFIREKYSLERHLKNYAEDSPVSVLYEVYISNKRQIIKVLENIKIHFSNYTDHGSQHSKSIIASIEDVLGEERIKSLSACDTFLILMTSYLHDIGMYIEIKEEFVSDEFYKFISERAVDNESASYLVEFYNGKRERNVIEYIGNMQIMVAEYFREQHSRRSEEKILNSLDELGFLLDAGGAIPSRIIKILSKICSLHCKEIKDVMNIERVQSSGLGDYFHPRFVAIMIRIGDILDIDNNRVDGKLLNASYIKPNELNTINYEKHESIEHILITPKEIKIGSRSDDNRVLNEVRKTLNYLEEEIKHLQENWNVIVPDGFEGSAPKFEYYAKRKNSEEVFEDKNLQLNISPKKSFELIIGANIYKDKYVFVRELIQNAMDSIKRQFWRDYNKGNILFRREHRVQDAKIQEYDIDDLEFGKYKIQVSAYDGEKTADMKILKTYIGERTTNLLINEYDMEDFVAVVIEDNGIGISVDDLENKIIKITEKDDDRYRKEIESMPNWLRPTSGFGIGLHSVFQVTDRIIIQTKSEIDFENGRIIHIESGRNSGYISSEIWNEDKEENKLHRGARIILCIKKDQDIEELSEIGFKDFDFFESKRKAIDIKRIKHTISDEIKHSYFPIYMNGNEIDFQKDTIGEIKKNNYKRYDLGNYSAYIDYSNPVFDGVNRIGKYNVSNITIIEKMDGHTLRFRPRITFDNKKEVQIMYKGVNIKEERLEKSVEKMLVMGDEVEIDYMFRDTKEYLNLNRSSFRSNRYSEIVDIAKKLIFEAVKVWSKEIEDLNLGIECETYNKVSKEIESIMDSVYKDVQKSELVEKNLFNKRDPLLNLSQSKLIELFKKEKDNLSNIKADFEIYTSVLTKRIYEFIHRINRMNGDYAISEAPFAKKIGPWVNEMVLELLQILDIDKSELKDDELKLCIGRLRVESGEYVLSDESKSSSGYDGRESKIYTGTNNLLKCFLYNYKFGNLDNLREKYFDNSEYMSDFYIYDKNYARFDEAIENDLEKVMLYVVSEDKKTLERVLFGSEAIRKKDKLYLAFNYKRDGEMGKITSLSPIKEFDFIKNKMGRFYRYKSIYGFKEMLGIKLTNQTADYIFSEIVNHGYMDWPDKGLTCFFNKYYILPALEGYMDIAIENIDYELQVIYKKSIFSEMNQNGYILYPLTARDLNKLLETIVKSQDEFKRYEDRNLLSKNTIDELKNRDRYENMVKYIIKQKKSEFKNKYAENDSYSKWVAKNGSESERMLLQWIQGQSGIDDEQLNVTLRNIIHAANISLVKETVEYAYRRLKK